MGMHVVTTRVNSKADNRVGTAYRFISSIVNLSASSPTLYTGRSVLLEKPATVNPGGSVEVRFTTHQYAH